MAVVEDCNTRVEEQGTEALDQSQLFSSDTDTHKSLCCGAGWQAGQQSCSREGEGLFEGDCVVDDCCSAGNIHQFDAVVSPMQASASISQSTYDVPTYEIPLQHDLLQSIRAGRPDKERRPIDHGRCIEILEQSRRAILESGKTYTRYFNI